MKPTPGYIRLYPFIPIIGIPLTVWRDYNYQDCLLNYNEVGQEAAMIVQLMSVGIAILYIIALFV
jgi:hypothetical protein